MRTVASVMAVLCFASILAGQHTERMNLTSKEKMELAEVDRKTEISIQKFAERLNHDQYGYYNWVTTASGNKQAPPRQYDLNPREMGIMVDKNDCDRGGIIRACFLAGEDYLKGNGATQNEARAAAYFRKACDGHDAWGCEFLGTLYNFGSTDRISVMPDPAKAVSLYARACVAGLVYTCTDVADAYLTGRGARVDPHLATSIYRAVCESKSDEVTACKWWRRLQEAGEDSPAAPLSSPVLFTGLANIDEMQVHAQRLTSVEAVRPTMFYDAVEACTDAAHSEQMRRSACSLVNSLNLLAGVCQQERNPVACAGFAKMTLKNDKTDESKAAAAAFFQRACDLGDSKSCPEAQKLRKKLGM